uniref:Vacuolar protein sorting-associated protein 52 homolog (Trinotate prediction) n=1 Tax=Myxobolus squamalis TaxID=59785 RepID=A0A6B2FXF2_MYXSQ
MLGNRSTIISTELDAKVIKLKPSVSKTYSIEAILRSSYFLIISNSCEEYEFLMDFFLMNEENALEELNKIFYSSIIFLTTITETTLSECTDIICLLLSASLFKRFNAILYNRSFNHLKNYLDIIIEKSWCRLCVVVNLYIESIRSNDIPCGISYDQCHIITQQTSGLLSALYGLISDFEPSKLALLFTQLVQEWSSFVSIEASVFDDRNMQLVFEIVNYNMVLNMINVQPHIPLIFKELRIEHIHEESIPICNEIVNGFRKKYKNMIYQICHDHLFQFFGDMIALIKNPKPKLQDGAHKALTISINFTSTWKNSLMVISTDLKKLFIKNYLDQELIEACFSIFIELYKEYSLLISNYYPEVMKQLNEKGKVVDIQNILIEMKKYR